MDNDCFEEPLAPTAVRLAVMSSGWDLGQPGVVYTHNRRAPSSVAQRKGLVEADRGRVDEHMCSVALDVVGENGCGIGAAIHSWSFAVAHQTSVREDSSEGGRGRGWVHLASEGTGVEPRDCSWWRYYWREGSTVGLCQNRVCDVYLPYPSHHVHHPPLFDRQDQWRDHR